MDFFYKNERVRSYSIYEHDPTLKIAFGAFFFWPILIPDPLMEGQVHELFIKVCDEDVCGILTKHNHMNIKPCLFLEGELPYHILHSRCILVNFLYCPTIMRSTGSRNDLSKKRDHVIYHMNHN